MIIIIEKKKKKSNIHFEKYLKTKEEIFYVNSESPSGMPGAFVVSPKNSLGSTNSYDN